MDLVRNLRFAKRFSKIGGFRRRESVEIIFKLRFTVIIIIVGADNVDGFFFGVRVGVDGKIDGTPICAKEDVGRADVEEDHGISRTDVVLDSPVYGVRAFVREVNGDADFTAGAGGGGGCSCGLVAR